MCLSTPKTPKVETPPPPPPPPTPGADTASNTAAAGQDASGQRRRRGRSALTIPLAQALNIPGYGD